MNPHPPAHDYKLEDPHHEHDHDHGHTIVSWKTLVGVLAILLAFTALTVSAAQGEKWIASAFDVVLPDWMNVAVAMSIATVKGILVMMFFMQLKYDNPFNTIIMLFCFLAFSLFLGFTALDLTNRAWIEPWKMAQISRGGTGMEGTPLVWRARENVAKRRYHMLNGRQGVNGDPLSEDPAQAATLAAEAIAHWQHELGEAAYDAEIAELAQIMDRAGIEAYVAAHGWEHYNERLTHYDPRAAGHASHASHASSTGSSAERSRPRTGLSGALSTEAHDAHGHDDHADHEHEDDAHHDEADHAASEAEHAEERVLEGAQRLPETGPDAANTPVTPPTNTPATPPH